MDEELVPEWEPSKSELIIIRDSLAARTAVLNRLERTAPAEFVAEATRKKLARVAALREKIVTLIDVRIQEGD